jgi:hypothetical protein
MAMVRDVLRQGPLSGHLFVFFSKRLHAASTRDAVPDLVGHCIVRILLRTTLSWLDWTYNAKEMTTVSRRLSLHRLAPCNQAMTSEKDSAFGMPWPKFGTITSCTAG